MCQVCQSKIRQWKIWGYVLSLHWSVNFLIFFLAEPIGHTSFGYSAGCGGYRIAESWLPEGVASSIRNWHSKKHTYRTLGVWFQYFTVPHRFRLESGNSIWNSTRMAPEFVTRDSQDSLNLLYLINKVYFWLFILFYIQFKLMYTN